MERRRQVLKIDEAVVMPKQELRPCRSCDLTPSTCGQQKAIAEVDGFNTSVVCDIKGLIRREERKIRIERKNGKSETNTSFFGAAAAGL